MRGRKLREQIRSIRRVWKIVVPAVPAHAVQVQVVQALDYMIRKMKALYSLKTSVAIYRSTQRNKPEKFNL
jgi:hypothetical protein